MERRVVVALVVASAGILVGACSDDADACGDVVEVRAEQLSFPTSDICAMVAGKKSCEELCGAPFNRCDVTGQSDRGELPFACPGTPSESALVYCRQARSPNGSCNAP